MVRWPLGELRPVCPYRPPGNLTFGPAAVRPSFPASSERRRTVPVDRRTGPMVVERPLFRLRWHRRFLRDSRHVHLVASYCRGETPPRNKPANNWRTGFLPPCRTLIRWSSTPVPIRTSPPSTQNLAPRAVRIAPTLKMGPYLRLESSPLTIGKKTHPAGVLHREACRPGTWFLGREGFRRRNAAFPSQSPAVRPAAPSFSSLASPAERGKRLGGPDELIECP